MGILSFLIPLFGLIILICALCLAFRSRVHDGLLSALVSIGWLLPSTLSLMTLCAIAAKGWYQSSSLLYLLVLVALIALSGVVTLFRARIASGFASGRFQGSVLARYVRDAMVLLVAIVIASFSISNSQELG